MFSIVIPTYNSSKTIDVPVASLNSQTFKDFEVVFADDGSSDFAELSRLIAARAKFSFRICPLPRHINVSGARNHGVAQTDRPYVCFLDSDDAWEPNKLAEIAAFMVKSQTAVPDVIFHQVVCRKEDGSSFVYPAKGMASSQHVLDYLFFDNGLIHPSATVCARHVFQDAAFDESLQTHEDWDFLARACQAGRNFAFIEKPLATWMVRRMVGSGGRDSSAASLSWLSRSRPMFTERAETGFLVNIVFPKLAAEGKIFAAVKLLATNVLRRPSSTTVALVRLAQRVLAKTKQVDTADVQTKGVG